MQNLWIWHENEQQPLCFIKCCSKAIKNGLLRIVKIPHDIIYANSLTLWSYRLKPLINCLKQMNTMGIWFFLHKHDPQIGTKAKKSRNTELSFTLVRFSGKFPHMRWNRSKSLTKSDARNNQTVFTIYVRIITFRIVWHISLGLYAFQLHKNRREHNDNWGNMMRLHRIKSSLFRHHTIAYSCDVQGPFFSIANTTTCYFVQIGKYTLLATNDI